MQRIMFRCPVSAQHVYTGTTADDTTLQTDAHAYGSFTCSGCGLIHNWFRSEIWLESEDRSRAPHAAG